METDKTEISPSEFDVLFEEFLRAGRTIEDDNPKPLSITRTIAIEKALRMHKYLRDINEVLRGIWTTDFARALNKLNQKDFTEALKKLSQTDNMKPLNSVTISAVEKALRMHIDYAGVSGGKYLEKMDALAFNYKGSKSQKVSGLLNDYYLSVGVSNLKEALERLRKLYS